MSEIAIGRDPATKSLIAPRVALFVAGGGILAFIAMLVLGAYAPDLRSGKNGGAHALSNASVGFSGLVRLAQDTGRNPVIVRDLDSFDSEDLMIISPDDGETNLSNILDLRGPRATLLILPKWETAPDPRRRGWTRIVGPRLEENTERVLAPAHVLDVSVVKRTSRPLLTVPRHAPAAMRFSAPPTLQTVASKELKPIVTDQDGRIVLGQFGNLAFFVLADPDLFDNHGIRSASQARAALATLDFLNSTDAESVSFDVTANGLGGSRSPLKLVFDPPFLAVTLAIAAALLLAGLQALARFGPVRRPERAIGFGKAALVDNSAAMVRRAGRETKFGGRYADVIRRRAAALLRLPAGLATEEIDMRLDRAARGGTLFSVLAEDAAAARNRDELTQATRRLHSWLEELKA